MATPLDQRRFLFVTGKGGVGKTTVSAALAMQLAAQGKRVLVTACDAKERLSGLFGSKELGTEIQSVGDGSGRSSSRPNRRSASTGA